VYSNEQMVDSFYGLSFTKEQSLCHSALQNVKFAWIDHLG